MPLQGNKSQAFVALGMDNRYLVCCLLRAFACSSSAEMDSERVNHLQPTVTLSSLNFSLEYISPCEITESKQHIVCPLNTEL